MPSLLKASVSKISGSADIELLKHDWELLLSSWGTPSFFLSWLWIGNWVKILTPDISLYRVTVYRNNCPEALALFTSAHIRRKGVFSSHILALNESLAPNFDMMIEYNGFIGNRSDRDIYTILLTGLKEQLGQWDELQLGGVCEQSPFLDESLLKEQRITQKLVGESYARFVDLKKLRNKRSTFTASLKKKTRYKIRNYIKAFELMGAITVLIPDSADEALHFLNDLQSLHQPYWTGRGQVGSFANPAWVAFHQNIIREGFPSGRVQLLKVKVGQSIIGIIYSVVSDGTVYMIQSGYNYAELPDKHPGYVCLTKAIEYNLETGKCTFDFLAGDAQYKKSLATDAVKLKWVMLQRSRIKLHIENMLRGLKHKIQRDSDLSF